MTVSDVTLPLIVRNHLKGGVLSDGVCHAESINGMDYAAVWQEMKEFTRVRDVGTADEVWLLEHAPIFTLGQAGDASHLLDVGDIPVLKVDRGGQATYHGPGQIMLYLLADLTRLGLGVRSLVENMEAAVVASLADYGIDSASSRQAPGVYIEGKKIAALGLRISRGCSYHGLCFNFDFDTTVFDRINPCGDADMKITQLREQLSPLPSQSEVAARLVASLASALGYARTEWVDAA